MSDSQLSFDYEEHYPDRPGFVAGSATSEIASDSLDDSVLTRLRLEVFKFVASDPNGATCDEVEVALDMRHQTASARLRELELGGFVIIGDDRRLTRSRRPAQVYRVAPRRGDSYGEAEGRRYRTREAGAQAEGSSGGDPVGRPRP